MSKFLFCIKVCIGFLLCISADAANAQSNTRIFVATTGSNTNSGFESSPVLSINRAIELAKSGDTIILKPGIYRDLIRIGRNKRPLTIASEYILTNDTTVIAKTVFDGSTMPITPLIIDSSYTVQNPLYYGDQLSIIGFSVKNWKSQIINNGQRLRVSHMKFTGIVIEPTTAGSRDSYLFYNLKSSVIYNSQFFSNGIKSTQLYQYGIIDILDSTNIVNTKFTNNLGSEDLITIRSNAIGDTIKIINNYIENNTNSFNPSTPAMIMSRFIINASSIYSMILSNNLIVNNHGNIYINHSSDLGGVFIGFNTIYKNYTSSFEIRTSPLVLGISNRNAKYFVYNSIIADNTSFNSDVRQVRVQNGIFLNEPKPYLSIQNSLIGPLQDVNELNSLNLQIKNINYYDPRFVDLNNRDYALTRFSSGIGSGIANPALFIPSEDFRGFQRIMPAGSYPDIGAFESPYSGFEPELKFIESGDKRVRITWAQNQDGKKYRYQIFRSDKPISDSARSGWIAEIDQPGNFSFTDTSNLINKLRYYYRIQAVDSAGFKSGLSNELNVKTNVPPQKIQDLSILGGPSVAIKWRKVTVPDLIRYTVYRAGIQNPDSSTIISYLQVDTSFIDREVINGRNYFYWVKAVDSTGAASEFSERVSASITSSWFVGVNGNDNNNGSFSSPLKSISAAIVNARNRDSIIVGDGTYAEDIDLRGKALIIKSFNGAKKTIITGSDTVTVSRDFIRINSIQSRNGDDNMHFIGFTFKPNVRRHIQIDKSRSVFKNSIFTGFQEVFKTLYSTQFENSIFTDNFYIFGTATGNFISPDKIVDTTFFGYGPSFVNCVFNRNFNFVNRNFVGNPQLTGDSWSTLFMNCIMISNGPYATPPSNWSDNPTSNYYDRLTYVNTIIDTGLIQRPLFKNEGVDYRLDDLSPGIGRGVSQYNHFGKLFLAPQTDFDGNQRPSPLGSKPDIGAFENENSSPLPEIKLIQKINDTIYLDWDYAYRSSVTGVYIYRDTTNVIDTLNAIKKFRVFTGQNLQLVDTLLNTIDATVFYRIKLLLNDGTQTSFSLIKEANGVVKQKSFLPPMVNARYAWGDIDTDGDLDLAVMGETPGVFLQIYKNTKGVFTDLLDRSVFPQLFKGILKFADVDNDKDIDLIVTGQKTIAVNNLGTFLFRNDGNGNFASEVLVDVISTREGDMSFADHDNDGDLDMAICGIDEAGNYRLLIYNNDGKGAFSLEKRLFSVFPTSSFNIASNIKWVDFDNDGDQDLFYVGSQSLHASGVVINTLYTGNQTNAYFGSNIRYYEQLRASNASLDIADMNNDGWVDIVLSGTFSNNFGFNNDIGGKSSLIVFGNAGGFDLFSSYKIDNIEGKLKVADIDNDGDLDVVISGVDRQANPKTNFYYNDGSGRKFDKRNFQVIPNLDLSSFSIADYDNDNDVDLVLSGQKSTAQGGQVVSEVYSFEPDIRKSIPLKPSMPTIQNFGDGRIIVSLDSSNQNSAIVSKKNHLLQIGRIDNSGTRLKSTTVVESNNKGGILLNPETWLIYGDKYFTQLDPGNYYFISQVVDNNKLSSPISDTLFFTLSYPWKLLNQGGIINSVIEANSNQIAKWGDIDRDNDYDFIFGSTIYESDKINYFKSTYTFDTQSPINNSDVLQYSIKPYLKWHDINQDGVSDLIFSSTESISLTNATDSKFRLNIYRNNPGLTTVGRGNLSRLSLGVEDSIYLGNTRFKITDLNNDGKPDILLAGIDKIKQSKVHMFTTGPLATDVNAQPGFKFGRLKTNLDSILIAKKSYDLIFDFGDVDGDSDNDFVTFYKNELGDFVAATYLNDGINLSTGKLSFSLSPTYTFEALNNASIDLLDFDKDGDLDLLTSGRSFSTGQQFNVYESKNGVFVKVPNTIPAFEFAKLSFGDINNDGFTDLIYTGTREGSGLISKIGVYNPQTKLFQEQGQFLFGEEFSDLNIEFGDFDADSDLDLLVNGVLKGASPTGVFKVYKNVQNESAKVIAPQGGITNKSSSKTLTAESLLSESDDKSFETVLNNVVQNDQYIENAPPTTPGNLSTRLVGKIGSVAKVRFNWNGSTDDNTPVEGLTYELRVGSKSGIADEVVSLSLPNGYRMVAEEGNTGRKRVWDIELKPGTYYWSVQAVDASYAGSVFAEEKSFTIDASGQICNTNTPVLSLIGQSVFCEGDSVFLSADRKTEIQWFKNDKLINGAADSILKVFETGIYTAKYGNATCSSTVSAPVQVNVKPRPAAGSVSVSANTVCEGTKVVLTASSDSVYQWFRNDTLLSITSSKSIEVTAPALYSVNTKVNGCVSNKSSAVTFKVNPFPKAIISKNSSSACEGSTVALTAFSETGYTFQWQKNEQNIAGATTSTFAASESGRYRVLVTLNGCNTTSANDSITIFTKPAKPVIIKEGVELVSSSATGNQWYAEGNSINGANQQRFKPTNNGNYAVKVVLNGCESSQSDNYYFLVTSLIDLPSGQYIRIYPNPVEANGKVTIEKKLGLPNEVVNVQVLDQSGKLIVDKRITSDKSVIQLPVTPGSYFIVVKRNGLNVSTFMVLRN